MDILDILLDILLKPPQPFIGLFLIIEINITLPYEALRVTSSHFEGSFLGGLSLHLNHLIGSRMTNYDWPFGTLPFGLFGSNLDTTDLETYPKTYSGHF